jgi:nucleotide-binding universal stress UspA family protein
VTDIRGSVVPAGYVCTCLNDKPQFMANGVLCTIDFSDSSRDAVKRAIQLAHEFESSLTILFAFRLFKHNGEAVEMKKQIEHNAQTKFERLENELLKDAGVCYEFKAEVGFVDDRIERHARENNVRFLVMGESMHEITKESLDDLASQLQIPMIIIP